ncbi:xanthine dehydrogenase family protein molybdopterin-binding subunit [Methylobacterium organophilum]|uniref:4-hydroxybenzoyl-CoA reductase subunit alpha n=1 Tax=Methylobacterium organophilum TaxID=410 RepID=A0ABQ4TI28_METOR|nr:xanthine dehydrogenase family protein molybdopterin-binding subunit [Methylobacterium organophilum]GJE29662.1 4-hydroxybenzoyl-CoA reductase subunit alpha [Methylobacterium organophilum]
METFDGAYARPDAFGKVAGETIYAADYAEPGMLHGVLLRAPVAAGRIVRLDLGRARGMPGVRAVVSAADVPPVLAGWIIRDTPMFASDVVRYIGEPIAAVAADTLDQARRAVDAILLEIEPVPVLASMESALAEGAGPIHPDLSRYVLADQEGTPYPRYGNVAAESATLENPRFVEEAFAAAALVVEDEFRTQRQYQGYLEPKGAVGIFREGRITVHSGTQWPYNIRARLCQYFAMPTARVRVIGHPYGGGFGGKLDTSVEPHAVALSRAAGGRAVKILNTRAEDITCATAREGTIVRLRSALDAEGNIIARDADCLMDNGAYTGETAFLACFPFYFAAMSYRVGRLRARSRLVYTNTPPTAAMRGVTGVPMYAALETHMDHIADKLGVDRREYRLRHHFKDGDKLPNGQVLHDASILRQQFAAVEEVAPWDAYERKPWRGRAIAPALWLVNPLPGSATAKLQEDGSVVLLTGANENGTGSVAVGLRQIVAQELGIAPDAVVIPDPDTDIGGFDGGSQGSRTLQVAGNAALAAARELKGRILETAAPMLQASADALEMTEGFVRVRAQPGRRVALATVGAASTFGLGTLAGSGRSALPPVPYNPSCASGLLFAYFASPTYHVHYIEVAVDPVLGTVTIERYVVAQEVGKVVNLTSLRGQIQGGVAQGLGFGLCESLRIDDEGRTLEASLGSYRLPLAINTPRVESILTEHPSADGPFGAKGSAEPPILLPAALVACAVSDAIGRPIRKIPVTPEDVLAAIMDGERETATS